MQPFTWKATPWLNASPSMRCDAGRKTKTGSGAAMGTASRPQDRRVLGSFRKVSKPLMEKKRRARINLSLEQLKALLEKHCSHQIRKRKLEKADILELSVKYLKSLQHSEQGLPSIPKSADYQAGFWSCLQGVRQLLLSPEAAGDAPAFPAQMPLEPAPALPAWERNGGGFSTTDSGPPPALPGCLEESAPEPQALRPPSEGCAPSAGGRGQARGPGDRGRPERGQPLWRPW